MPVRDSEPINLTDGYPGFPVTAFCIPERYAPYLSKVLISNGMIQDRLQRLAAHIVESCETMGIKDISLMCVLKGGFKFFSDLIEQMQRIIWARKTELCITVEFIRVKSYTDTSSGDINIRSIDSSMPLEGKDILVVDDIVDTGKTMVKLSEYLMSNGARSVMTCCLLLKHTSLNIGYRPDCMYCLCSCIYCNCSP
uniref:Hypoxanthine phosphoribosyltransferase n=1 Tax=Mesocestoides corti TaxID=53468 RepID=A0A5K3FC11_MESCO